MLRESACAGNLHHWKVRYRSPSSDATTSSRPSRLRSRALAHGNILPDLVIEMPGQELGKRSLERPYRRSPMGSVCLHWAFQRIIVGVVKSGFANAMRHKPDGRLRDVDVPVKPHGAHRLEAGRPKSNPICATETSDHAKAARVRIQK